MKETLLELCFGIERPFYSLPVALWLPLDSYQTGWFGQIQVQVFCSAERKQQEVGKLELEERAGLPLDLEQTGRLGDGVGVSFWGTE